MHRQFRPRHPSGRFRWGLQAPAALAALLMTGIAPALAGCDDPTPAMAAAQTEPDVGVVTVKSQPPRHYATSYPGASPENLYNSVTRLIEEELDAGILNFESTSESLRQVESSLSRCSGFLRASGSRPKRRQQRRTGRRSLSGIVSAGVLGDASLRDCISNLHAWLIRINAKGARPSLDNSMPGGQLRRPFPIAFLTERGERMQSVCKRLLSRAA